MRQTTGSLKGLLPIFFFLMLLAPALADDSFMSVIVRPINSTGYLTPNTAYPYVFNFTEYQNCSGVLFSYSDTITTDRYGIGNTTFNITSMTTAPSYICEYQNGTLRATHRYDNRGLFKNIFSSGNIYMDGDSKFYLDSINGDSVYIQYDKSGTGNILLSGSGVYLPSGQLIFDAGGEIDWSDGASIRQSSGSMTISGLTDLSLGVSNYIGIPSDTHLDLSNGGGNWLMFNGTTGVFEFNSGLPAFSFNGKITQTNGSDTATNTSFYWDGGYYHIKMGDYANAMFIGGGDRDRMIYISPEEQLFNMMNYNNTTKVEFFVDEGNQINQGNMTADFFLGDGSQLTNLPVSAQYWNRTGTTLEPKTFGDNLNVTGTTYFAVDTPVYYDGGSSNYLLYNNSEGYLFFQTQPYLNQDTAIRENVYLSFDGFAQNVAIQYDGTNFNFATNNTYQFDGTRAYFNMPLQITSGGLELSASTPVIFDGNLVSQSKIYHEESIGMKVEDQNMIYLNATNGTTNIGDMNITGNVIIPEGKSVCLMGTCASGARIYANDSLGGIFLTGNTNIDGSFYVAEELHMSDNFGLYSDPSGALLIYDSGNSRWNFADSVYFNNGWLSDSDVAINSGSYFSFDGWDQNNAIDYSLGSGLNFETNESFKFNNNIFSRNIYPATTNTYDLGNSTFRWKTLYVGGIDNSGNMTGNLYYGEISNQTTHVQTLTTINTWYNITNMTGSGLKNGWTSNAVTNSITCNVAGTYVVTYTFVYAQSGTGQQIDFQMVVNGTAEPKSLVSQYTTQNDIFTTTGATFFKAFNIGDTVNIQVRNPTSAGKTMTFYNKDATFVRVGN